MKGLTAERLRELLLYDAITGNFTWLADMRTGRGKGRVTTVAGSKAGCVCSDRGYQKIGIDGGRYYVHRLAFLWMTGQGPVHHVDHIDGNPRNNAWANLRDVTRFTNLQNRHHSPAGSKLNLLGVTANHKRFMAQITTNKQYRYLGTFDTALEAHAAYVAAKRQLHEGCSI